MFRVSNYSIKFPGLYVMVAVYLTNSCLSILSDIVLLVNETFENILGVNHKCLMKSF